MDEQVTVSFCGRYACEIGEKCEQCLAAIAAGMTPKAVETAPEVAPEKVEVAPETVEAPAAPEATPEAPVDAPVEAAPVETTEADAVNG